MHWRHGGTSLFVSGNLLQHVGNGSVLLYGITVTFYAMYVANNFKSKSRIHWFLLGTWGKFIV